MAHFAQDVGQLGQLEDSFPPPLPPISELPIEEWTREFMEGNAPRKGLYDEDFFSWYEELARHHTSVLRRRIAEAWGVDWLHAKLGLSEAECCEVLERAAPIVPPYIASGIGGGGRRRSPSGTGRGLPGRR